MFVSAGQQAPPEPAKDLDKLEREICELAAHLAAATCRWLTLVGEFDERGGWAEWGVNSCAHWLSWRCSIGLGAARDQVRVARHMRKLPRVAAAFATGELSYSKVRAITRVATPETEEDLVRIALHSTGAQLEKVVRGYRGALAATLDAAQAGVERRYLRWNWEDDGSLRVVGRLPAEDGALLLAALRAAEATPPPVEPEGETPPSFTPTEEQPGTCNADERCADALVTVARAAVDSGNAPRTGGDPCEIVVHVDAETLASDRVCDQSRLEDGPALAPETVRRLGCDGSLVRIIERDGRPLSVGRRTRSIPPALRRALRARDDGCRFPGCTHRRFLHAHHIQHWARGGKTNLDNLVNLCSHHHRLVHEGGYVVEQTGPRSIRFRRPDGRTIPAVGKATRATGPPLERRRRQQQPSDAQQQPPGAQQQSGAQPRPDPPSLPSFPAGGPADPWRREAELRAGPIDRYTCMPRSAGDALDYGIAVEGLLATRSAAPDGS